MKPAELAGRRFGLLVVVRRESERGRFKTRPWICACDCGGTKTLPSRTLLGAERRGANQNCGCQKFQPLNFAGTPAQRVRARRIAEGLCQRCGRNPFPEGRRVCDECLSKGPAGAKRHRYMTPEQRFWAVITKTSAGCWEFPSPTYKGRRIYGSLGVGEKKKELAHRFSYELHNGPIPEGLFVCHRCDNPPCVNPDHLFLGTAQDNTADMDAKGRRVTPRGEDSGSAVLTADLALEIWRSNGRRSDIASKFGVSRGAVQAIHEGKTWRHVTGGPAQRERLKARQPHAATAQQIAEIASMTEAGARLVDISKSVGLSQVTVSKYRRQMSRAFAQHVHGLRPEGEAL